MADAAAGATGSHRLMPLTSQPMCLVIGTNSSIPGTAGSRIETMLIARTPVLVSSRGVLAQQACCRQRRSVQHNIRLDRLRELVWRASHRIDADLAQDPDEIGIVAQRCE